MLKIKDNARAWQFKGGMFSAVDIIREMGMEDAGSVTYHPAHDWLSIYDPVGDESKTARVGDWIVRTDGSRVLIYAADAFCFAFND